MGGLAPPPDTTEIERTMTSAARKQPVSSHPAFRWAVGAWFAALLGGGLFVMPDAVHASLGQSIGIDALIPAGIPARLVISGIGALLGLLLGLAIAMRAAALGKAATADCDEEVETDANVWLDDESLFDEADSVEDTEGDPRRPFNPREYLADEGIESWEPENDFEPPDDSAPTIDETEDQAGPAEDFPDQLVEPLVEAAEAGEAELLIETADEEEWLPEVGEMGEADLQFHHPVTAAVAPNEEAEAFGDLSLAELTARLGRAIEARRAAEVVGAADDDVDPVIAFLRREADRASPVREGTPASGEDSQAVLRGALDRLSRVSNPR
ncbi:hypothetical protein [Erythrobacter mangrovi]|uniref:Uncharacterized protein n=1 Tax=Erythrobacter mangrovi TaxID=2739433 RepID=A0A7D4B950_9SPHN|nr:hypothetical protein [Erythrobacter mangrovi]QKG70761.1 hypothetical protein HQR01_04920 [Erythrobacter mangrovi]